jgi:hypothetical protein
MFKKKQARFSVSIPYELRDNKLWMRSITWPDQCPCCDEKDSAALGTYKYEHKARYSQTSTGSTTTTTSLPLEWEVPYCLSCQEHMKIAENWKNGIFAVCFLLPIILTLIIDASSSMLILLLYALFIIGGFALYTIIVKAVVKPKLNPTCLDYNLAFWASSPPTDDYRVVFNFERDEYAQAFAELNMAELENNTG